MYTVYIYIYILLFVSLFIYIYIYNETNNSNRPALNESNITALMFIALGYDFLGVYCYYWLPMFPIHWFICGGPPQYQQWLPQIDVGASASHSLRDRGPPTTVSQNPVRNTDSIYVTLRTSFTMKTSMLPKSQLGGCQSHFFPHTDASED